MTHGHFVIRNPEGREINVYTWHDGQIGELIENLRDFPLRYAANHWWKNLISGAENALNIHSEEEFVALESRTYHTADMCYDPCFATDFCRLTGPNVGFWTVIPESHMDGMSRPGPHLVVYLDHMASKYSIIYPCWYEEEFEDMATDEKEWFIEEEIDFKALFCAETYRLVQELKAKDE